VSRPASSYANPNRPRTTTPARPTTGSRNAPALPDFAQRWTGSTPSSPGARPSFGSQGSGPNDPNRFNPGGPSRITSSNWNNYRILEGPAPQPGMPDRRSVVPGVTLPRYGQAGGTFGSQRMGRNPDALEAFPYGSITVTQEQAENLYDRLTPAYQNWLTSLAQTPGIGTGASTGRSLWARLVSRSIDLQNDGLNMSPQQMAAQIAASRGIGLDLGDPASYGGASGPGGYRRFGGGGGGGGGSSSIDLSSPTQARSIITQVMQNLLGRDPDASEISDFTKALNEAQRANPVTVEGDGSTVTRSGGIEADVFAMDYVKGKEGFEDRQANQYYKLFMNILSGSS
jgi:hypothetical protein